MKKLASVGGVAGVAVVALFATQGRAADHADSPSASNPLADITDVYSWMTGSNLNLVMDVSPQDDGTRSFGPAVTYVFHLTSKPGLGVQEVGGPETRVILRFESNTSVQCWVTDATGTTMKDYVTGDPSNTTGLTSSLGKVKVFAGRRSDPFFFNQSGFDAAVATLKTTVLTPDPSGCPMGINDSAALALRNSLSTGGPDAFLTKNVMAIVVQIDKSLVNDGTNTTVAVWGSTHAGS